MASIYVEQADMSAEPIDEMVTAPIDADFILPSEANQVLRALERAFGQSFSVIDCGSGQTLRAAKGMLAVDLYPRLSACEQIAQRKLPEILDEVSPVLLLAVPLPSNNPVALLVAVTAFLTDQVESESQLAAAAAEFGLDIETAFAWTQTQTAWPPKAIQEVSSSILEKMLLQQSTAHLKRQLADISSHLLMTFEEITLLHRLTEHLSISQSVTDICELSVNWLGDVIPANAVAIWFRSFENLQSQHAQNVASQPVLITHGNCPLTQQSFHRFIERLGPRVTTEPLVLNRGATSSPTWFYPDVREIISVPIREGNRLFGWLLALNHTGTSDITNSEAEFGTVEACLMASVATILGIHCGNIALYHEQSEFFSSVVRALTSAIDAKDPYTCGHSDRVARLAVCLARKFGCNVEDLNTIYLSGLLHDIGKIGIDDNVLRKPGALTPAEFEHIKTHPDLGCRILDGVKQLDKVLPVVRHHHEAWDGTGYPAGLKGEDTPLLARIVAVADSIDAMSSDRPYRKGIPDEKLNAILRNGAGKQWDAKIIDAAFHVRDELRRIGQEERHPLSLDVTNWQAETTATRPKLV
ncbi:MAG TPA: HD-GYP domain-containing protein [Lacipirellulaceae bacterium]|nr:HD-GYP domain-containing protein [Lacipirellulaceae bacterium]